MSDVDVGILEVMTTGDPLRAVKAAGGKLSDADFAKLSAAQKLDYTRQFDQTQFQANPSPR
jgi:hypothetical protein